MALATWSMCQEALEESNIPQMVDLLDYHRLTTDFQTLIDRTAITL